MGLEKDRNSVSDGSLCLCYFMANNVSGIRSDRWSTCDEYFGDTNGAVNVERTKSRHLLDVHEYHYCLWDDCDRNDAVDYLRVASGLVRSGLQPIHGFTIIMR